MSGSEPRAAHHFFKAQLVEWNTRRTQNAMPKGMRVQVPCWAPNRQIDDAIVHVMSTSLQSRRRHLELVVDPGELADWTVQNALPNHEPPEDQARQRPHERHLRLFADLGVRKQNDRSDRRSEEVAPEARPAQEIEADIAKNVDYVVG